MRHTRNVDKPFPVDAERTTLPSMDLEALPENKVLQWQPLGLGTVLGVVS